MVTRMTPSFMDRRCAPKGWGHADIAHAAGMSALDCAISLSLNVDPPNPDSRTGTQLAYDHVASFRR
jgi:hypothetical protein